MSFSFGKVLAGLTCGVTIPFIVHDNVYYAIATSFLSPHLKYHYERTHRNKDLAIPVESLDSYLKDIGKSFLFFWLIIGPTLYKTYYKGENMYNKEELDASSKEDTYSSMLLKIKSAEKAQKSVKADET